MQEPSGGRPVLFSADDDGAFVVWDLESRAPVTRERGDRAELVAVVGEEFPGPLAAIQGGRVAFLQRADGATFWTSASIGGYAPTAAALVVLPSGPELAVGAADGSVSFVRDGAVIRVSDAAVTALAGGVVDGGPVLVAGDEHGDVFLVWNPPRQEPMQQLPRSAVRDLQRRLRRLGFDPGHEDGVIGPNTSGAVRAFQKAAGLHADGIAGPDTLASLSSAEEKERAEATRGPESVIGDPVRAVGVSSASDEDLVVATIGGELRFWSAVAGEERTFEGATAADLARRATAGVDVWRRVLTETGPGDVTATAVWTEPGDSVGGEALGDGASGDVEAAYGYGDGSIRLWRGGKPVGRPLVGHEAPVRALAFGRIDQDSPFLGGRSTGSTRTPSAGLEEEAETTSREGATLDSSVSTDTGAAELRNPWMPPGPVERLDHVTSGGGDGGASEGDRGASDRDEGAHERDEAASEREQGTSDGGEGASEGDAAAVGVRAAYSRDAVAGDELDDHLRIERDVQALCAVVAARDAHPPLAIGLFGDWGSGKTFFMRSMQARVARLAAAAREAERQGGDTAYCAEIAQVWFNAWHFIDANLWASIVTRIFEGVASHFGEDSTDWDQILQIAPVAAERLAAARETREAAAAERDAASQGVEAAASRLARAEEQVRAAASQPKRVRDYASAALRDPAVGREMAETARDLGWSEAPSTLEALDRRRDEVAGTAGRLAALWRVVGGPDASPVTRVAILVAALATPLVLAGVAVWIAAAASDGVRALLGAGTALAAWFVEKMAVIDGWRRQVDRGLVRLERVHADLLRQASEDERRDLLAAEAELERAKADLAEQRRRVAEAERRVTEAETLRARVRSGEYVSEFLRQRSAQPGYRDELGIIDLIRRDFEGLSRLVAARNAKIGEDDDARAIAEGVRLDRIVLYIDDLDRCPSDRVVEVLQAVHLLLAFDLFVVVVGVDSRWLLHALAEEFTAFESRAGMAEGPEHTGWRTTPQNYLEKIFQIPFTLHPMGTTGYENLIDALTTPRRDEDGARTAVRAEGAPRPAAEGDDAPGTAAETIDGSATAERAIVGTPAPGAPADLGATATASDGARAASADAATDGGATEERPRAEEPPPWAQAPHTELSRTDRGDQEAARSQDPRVADGVDAAARGSDDERPEPSASVAEAAQGRQGAAEPGEKVDASPPQLVLTEDERRLMRSLDELIPTPRTAKRFVNIYRLVKASVPDRDLPDFLGRGDVQGHYQAVLLLLAIQSGFPAQAAGVFLLVKERARGSWWQLVDELAPPGRSRGSGPWRNAASDDLDADAVRSWRLLTEGLQAQRPLVPLDDLAVYARWIDAVARYGFTTGRLLAPRRRDGTEAVGTGGDGHRTGVDPPEEPPTSDAVRRPAAEETVES